MPSRDPAVTEAYLEYQKENANICPFCELGDREILDSYENFVIVRALFPYEIWDEKQVLEHLMILPKRHVEILSELSSEEATGFLSIVSDYEVRGYSIYARAPQDMMRSVKHQHTHLLLLER